MEYPKAVYHPKDGKRYEIAVSASQEEEILEAWGAKGPPKITLSSAAPAGGSEPVPAAPKVRKPAAKRAAHPKAGETK